MARSVATPRLPKPTASYVQGLYQVQRYQGDEEQLRSTIQELRTLTAMEHAIEVPAQYRQIATQVRTPFARDSWLRVAAALTQNKPVPKVEPRQDREDGKRAAALAARWTDAALENMLHPATQDVAYEAVRVLIRDSESVIKVVHRPDAWGNFPKRTKDEPAETYNERADGFKRENFPFGWRVVDRLQMLFGNGEWGDDWALEYGEYPRPYLAGRYGMTAIDRGGEASLVNPRSILGGSPEPQGELVTATGKAIKIEYWDADWWHVIIDGSDAPGFPKKNPYSPKLPYVRAQVSDPILLPLRWLVPTLDALLTMKTNWAYLGAYPNPVIEGVPNLLAPNIEPPIDADGSPSNITWSPGKAIELPMGKTLKFLVPPPVGQDLNQMVTLLRDLIDVAGVPSVFRGVGGSDQAGYAINQLIAAATLTYRILAQQAEKQLETVGEFLWWVVANRIRQTVYVDDPLADGAKESIGLSPDGKLTANVAPVTMLKSLDYRFRPVLPTDEQARAMIAMQLVNAPKQLVSKAYAQEHYLQVEDPQAMQDDIWVEQTLDSDPNLHQKVVDNALYRAGLGPPPAPALPPGGGSGLVGPNGQPLGAGNVGQPPGQAGAGTPSVGGINQPMGPSAPQVPAIAGGTGGRPAGAFPGAPNTPITPNPGQ